MRRYGKGQAGTTIVEIAVGMAVGAVLVAGVLTLIEQSQKAYMHSSEAADLQQNIRVGMDRVTRLVQSAGVNPKNKQWGAPAPGNDPAFTAFREAGRNCIRLYADLNGDGDLNVGAQAEEADENVYFHWSTTSGEALTEQRGTNTGQPDFGSVWVAGGPAAQKLADGLIGGTSIFRYYTGPLDTNPGVELVPPAASTTSCASLSAADRARISLVVINLTGRTSIGNQTLTKTLTSDARARNVP